MGEVSRMCGASWQPAICLGMQSGVHTRLNAQPWQQQAGAHSRLCLSAGRLCRPLGLQCQSGSAAQAQAGCRIAGRAAAEGRPHHWTPRALTLAGPRPLQVHGKGGSIGAASRAGGTGSGLIGRRQAAAAAPRGVLRRPLARVVPPLIFRLQPGGTARGRASPAAATAA